jgi:prolyl-tRNA synthetase
VDGIKSDSEKFAGASRTYSIEALMGDGGRCRPGPRHNLGQNFAKAFEIQFQGRDKALQHVWTTSWGVSTRLIGGVIMTHGDDSGLILPPNIAPHQVVIVPIPRGNWKETVLPKAMAIRDELVAKGIRVKVDARRELARLEVCRVGAAGGAAAAGNRAQGHREGPGVSRRVATRARRQRFRSTVLGTA